MEKDKCEYCSCTWLYNLFILPYKLFKQVLNYFENPFGNEFTYHSKSTLYLRDGVKFKNTMAVHTLQDTVRELDLINNFIWNALNYEEKNKQCKGRIVYGRPLLTKPKSYSEDAVLEFDSRLLNIVIIPALLEYKESLQKKLTNYIEEV